MRKSVLLLAATALTAVFALPALAATPNSTRTHNHWLAGSVSAVSSNSVTVGVLWTGPRDGALNGQSVTLSVDSTTSIVSGKDRTPVLLSSLQPGDLVGVRATGSGADLTTLAATRIHVYCNCHWVGGKIAAIGTSTLTVQVNRTGPFDTVLGGQSVTIGLGADTSYLQGRAKTAIQLSDLKVGESVGVVFSANGFFKAPGFDPSTATFVATRVHVWGHGPVPAASSDGSVTAQVSA
jgi:hypothetical protein